jgi:hypothetical protein
VICKLYPGSEAECRWTIADVDTLVAEQLWTGILDVAALGNYYCMFYTVTSFSLMRNHISEAEQTESLLGDYNLLYGIAVRGHPSVPSPPLLSPCSYVLPPHLCTISRDHTQRLTTFIFKVRQLSYSKSDDFPEVDSPNVVDFPRPPPLVP